MKTVIVTGGAGYIGSHVVRQFHNNGFNVIVMDDLSNTKSIVTPSVARTFLVDISKYEQVSEFFTKIRNIEIDGVIHLAGKIYVGESMQEPELYKRVNTHGTLNLMFSMLRNSIRKLVFASSAAVYGNSKTPLHEYDEINPASPYAISKVEAEDIITLSNIPHINLRLFNVAGCSWGMRAGDLRYPSAHIIPAIVDAVIEGNNSITLNGNQYDTPDGTCIRDYIHVEDVAHAFFMAYMKVDELNGQSFNVCSGKGISNLQVIRAAEEILGCKIEVIVKDNRPGDGAILVGNNTRLKNILTCPPFYDNIHTLIKSTYDYRKKRHAWIYPF